jgi:4-amino-4-deoxy-L-arabinose transferase-like glycosyltransferase
VIVLVALVLRACAVFVMGDTELQNEYAPLVMNLLAGRGFAYFSIDQHEVLTAQFLADPKLVIPSAFKSPVYPFFLAALVKTFGPDRTGMLTIELIQALLGAWTCWLVYEIALEKFGKPQAVLAAIGLAVYPLLVFASSQISDTVIFLTLESLSLWLFVRLEKGFSLRRLGVFSLCFGLFMLARPEGFLYFPFLLLWLWVSAPERKGRAIFIFVSLCVVMVLPWGLRNYVQLGKFTLNTSGGLNLWEGQNKNAVGVPSWYVEPLIRLPEEMNREISSLRFDREFEVRQDGVYFRQALADLSADPGRALGLAFRKAVFFWTSLFFGFNFTYAGAKSPLYWLPWLALLPFFLAGLVLSFKEHRRYWAFYLVLLISTFTCMVFFVLPRYTMLVYPWVILFAAHGLWTIYRSSFAKKVSNGLSGRGA